MAWLQLASFDRPPIEAVLIRRYKRFLAEVKILKGLTTEAQWVGNEFTTEAQRTQRVGKPDNHHLTTKAQRNPAPAKTLTAHCPNTGSMLTLGDPGLAALLTESSNPKRKLAHTLEAVRHGKSWVCVNTHRANALTKILLEKRLLTPFDKTPRFRTEVLFQSGTRFDFFLEPSGTNPRGTFLEVKSVTLSLEPGTACFPDAVTLRGQRHLQHLMEARRQGYGAALLFLCMRGDCSSFNPAVSIDPEYAGLLKKAVQSDVKCLCYRIRVTKRGYFFDTQPLPICL